MHQPIKNTLRYLEVIVPITAEEKKNRDAIAMLRKRGAGQRCYSHPKRVSRLGILWADGRAIWFSCGQACLNAWKKRTGKMACIVLVATVN
jgi:hypothetical protein